jgi:hypothetical protein
MKDAWQCGQARCAGDSAWVPWWSAKLLSLQSQFVAAQGTTGRP